jgi:Calcium-binding EGF domain
VDDNTQVVADNEGRELKRGFFLCEVSSSQALCRKGKQLCDTSIGVARCICEAGWKGSRCEESIYEPPSILPTSMPTSSRIGNACILSSDCTTQNAYCVEGQCQCQPGFTRQKGHCYNINECEKGYPNGCNRYADCIDMEGGYQCICKDGFADANPDIPGRNCQQTNECQLRTHNCDEATQVCVDRRPPEKWECVERTPAPTPKPTPKPVTTPTLIPARTKTCYFGGTWSDMISPVTFTLTSECVCESSIILGLGKPCFKIAASFFTLVPNETTCINSGGTCSTL